jgi:hypothetical protein
MSEVLGRDNSFSFQCHACGRCCYGKRIQVNPYELLRLSRNRGIRTGEFAHRFLERGGPYLRVTPDGACVFLDGARCSVHEDRPLACRTYPLGRWVSSQRVETFRVLKLHPHGDVVIGQEGTVGQFLEEQGALPYLRAADLYQALVYRLVDRLHHLQPMNGVLAGEARDALFAMDEKGAPSYMEWLDADRMVELYCRRQALDLPVDVEGVMALHIQAIDAWLEKIEGAWP